MLVDIPIGPYDLIEVHDRLDDPFALDAACREQLPGGVGLPAVVPARVIPVRLALGAREEEGRTVEVGLATQV
jgi:hypothetical protein